MQDSERAPPHSRGSSRARATPDDRRWGSPALAGIIPRWCRSTPTHGGLPRTRGDHPLLNNRLIREMRAPPHSRGSSLIEVGRQHLRGGSPALAGIIPAVVEHRGDRSWLPRTRGDHPVPTMNALSSARAPPHSRGSSLDALHDATACRGSPALAGIIPAGASAVAFSSRLPRTRGDHPPHVGHSLADMWAPPHSRGSSSFRSFTPAGGSGSPALAGIIPRR